MAAWIGYLVPIREVVGSIPNLVKLTKRIIVIIILALSVTRVDEGLVESVA